MLVGFTESATVGRSIRPNCANAVDEANSNAPKIKQAANTAAETGTKNWNAIVEEGALASQGRAPRSQRSK
jgi:hypothetical protein